MGQGGQPLRDLDQALLGVLAAAPETAKLLSTIPERRSRTMRSQYPDSLESADWDELDRREAELGDSATDGLRLLHGEFRAAVDAASAASRWLDDNRLPPAERWTSRLLAALHCLRGLFHDPDSGLGRRLTDAGVTPVPRLRSRISPSELDALLLEVKRCRADLLCATLAQEDRIETRGVGDGASRTPDSLQVSAEQTTIGRLVTDPDTRATDWCELQRRMLVWYMQDEEFPKYRNDARREASVSAVETDWRDVKRHLLEMYDRDEPYTSVSKLAEQLGCSGATIHKAIKDSAKLNGWQARHTKRKGSPRASSLTEIVMNKTKQTREPDPSRAAEMSEEDDAIFNRLIQDAKTPAERAELHALSPEKRCTVIAMVRNDPDRGDRILDRRP